MEQSKRSRLVYAFVFLFLVFSVVAFISDPSGFSPRATRNEPLFQGARPSPTAGAQKFILTLSTSGTGSGTVSNLPAGTQFDSGTVVTLTATANAGSAFSGWVMNGITVSTASPFSFQMNADKAITAIFTAQSPQQYTLTVNKGGSGGGNVTTNPPGSTFAAGTLVTLTATPNSGSSFSGWVTGGVTLSTNNPYSFSMNADKTITAIFTAQPAPQYVLTVSLGGNGSGTISNNPAGTTFTAGTVVTLTASPNAGSSFSGWMIGGSTVSTNKTYAVIMDANKTVTGVFSLSLGPTSTATPTPTPSPTATSGPVATITPLLQGLAATTVTPTPSSALPATGLPLTWLAVGLALVLVLVAARYFRQSST